MKCSGILVCVLLAVVTVAFAQENASAGGSGAVKVLFVARDRSGKLLQDLKPQEITVIDNGAPAKVLGLEPAEKVPLRIGILLIAEETTFKAQQEAAIQLLGTLRPGTDQAFVLTQSTSPKPRPWPKKNLIWDSDAHALAALVRSLHWNDSVPATMKIVQQMLALDPDKPFRHVMVEFRNPYMEGMVDWGPMPYKELESEQMREISEYQRLNTIVYTSAIKILLRPHNPQLGIEHDTYQDGTVKIERTAVMTGARYLAWDKLKSEVAELEKDLQNQLLLSFASQPDNQQQRPHTLEIRINRKDVRVASPKQFYPATAGVQ